MYTQVGGCEVSEVANRSLSAWSGEGCGLQGYKAIPCASLLSREAVSMERDSLI